MYFPDRGCVRPLRHLYGYATAVRRSAANPPHAANVVERRDRRTDGQTDRHATAALLLRGQCQQMAGLTYLTQALVQFVQNAFFVEHFAVIASLVVVGDTLSELSWQLATDHVLFNLLQLQTRHPTRSS